MFAAHCVPLALFALLVASCGSAAQEPGIDDLGGTVVVDAGKTEQQAPPVEAAEDAAVEVEVPLAEAPPVRSESLGSLVGRGEFQGARELLEARIVEESNPAGNAVIQLALLNSLAFGQFQQALEQLDSLRKLELAEADRAGVQRAMVFLLSIAGRPSQALDYFLEPGAGETWSPTTQEALLSLLFSGGHGNQFEGDLQAADLLLAANKDNLTGLAVKHRLSIEGEHFSDARQCWDDLHLRGYLGDDMWSDAKQLVSDQLEKAAQGDVDWEALAIAYDVLGYHDETLSCAKHAGEASSPELEEAQARAQRFVEFRRQFSLIWLRGILTGFSGGGVERELRRGIDAFAVTLLPGIEVKTSTEIIDALREEYGYALVLDLESPIMALGALSKILEDSSKQRTTGGEDVRFTRMRTGDAILDFSQVWDPLIGGRKEGLHSPGWPATLVQGMGSIMTDLSTEWLVLEAYDQGLGGELPSSLLPDGLPLELICGFGHGNQGELIADRSVKAAREQAEEASQEEGTFQHEYKRVQLLSKLAHVEIHELQHLVDSHAVAAGGASYSRADLESRAELTAFIEGPEVTCYRRLALVATGGDKVGSKDPYEISNYDLLEGFVRALYHNPEVATALDRERNYQAQLHVLNAEDIRQLAKLVWEASFGED